MPDEEKTLEDFVEAGEINFADKTATGDALLALLRRHGLSKKTSDKIRKQSEEAQKEKG